MTCILTPVRVHESRNYDVYLPLKMGDADEMLACCFVGSAGFSFDEHLYPFPGDTFGWLHKKGITTAANLHDANGVGNYETMFPEMCKAMGLNPEAS